MKLFHRLTATFASTVSSAVSHVENHDAIVEAGLREGRAASAKARVRLMRLRKDGESLRRQLDECRQREALWAERAVSVAGEDEQKALACINRRNACRRQAEQTAGALARHEGLEREVSASVARIEARLAELTQQRNTLRSRHAAADAVRIVNQIEGNSAHGMEDIFDRWDMVITETEYAGGTAVETDALDDSFLKREDEAALRTDLEALLRESGATLSSHKE